MDAPPYFLGVELTAHNLVLLMENKYGVVQGMVTRSFAKNAGMLHDPQDWWRALRTGAKDLLRRTGVSNTDILAIGITGPNAGAVCLSAKGSILCQTSLGANDTLVPYAEELAATMGARNLLNLTGHASCPDCLAAQLLWLKDQHKRVWHDLAHVLLPRDFLRYRLTDTMITDPSMAAHTLLFNPRSRSWSKQIFDRLEVDPRWFPAIGNGPALSGRVTRTAATESGLAEGTVVVVGGGRSASLAVATGAVASGDAVVELGGDGVFTAFKNALMKPVPSLLHPGCHCLGDLWSVCQRGPTGNLAFDWFTRQLSAGEVQQWRRTGRSPLQVYAEFAAETQPGADGLTFIPAIPNRNAMSLTGVEDRHERGHVVRAIFEGSALTVRALIDRHKKQLPKLEGVRVTGQASEIGLWCHILADVLGRTVTRYELDQPAAQGSCLLASVAVGSWKSVAQALKNRKTPTCRYQPRKAAQLVYEQKLAKLQERADFLVSEEA